MGFSINFFIRDSTLLSWYTQTEGAGQQTKIINELHTWILNEFSQKSLVTILCNEIWFRQGGITLFGVYNYCKIGNKLTFTASPPCREIVLDNTKPQHLSHTDVSLHTSVEQFQPQSNSYSITLHIATALECPSSLAIFSKWSFLSEGIPWKLSSS